MKQGASINRIVMFLFFAAIVLYLGGATWKGLRDPYPTMPVYEYAVEDTVEATGYLVRREKVLTGSFGIVRLIPGEGEKVHAGATVALLYADQLSLERSDRLKVLENEVEQLTVAIETAGKGDPNDHSGENVLNSMISLRSAVEKGDLTRLESQSTAYKSVVYQQAQRYGEAADLSAAVVSTQSEIETLRAQTAQNVGRVEADRSGIFSGQVDGYENLLSPDNMELLTPSILRALDDNAQAVDATALGKLITDSTWYFVCPMTVADAQRCTVGMKVPVRFSRDWSGEVNMTVERIGVEENGQVPVILSSNRNLSDTTLLRRQTVELIFAQRPGLRVPTAAVRMEDGQSVVYVQVGVTAEKKPVTILAQKDDYTLVEPVTADDASEKQRKKVLRSGDAVIVAGEKIWDGMVLE